MSNNPDENLSSGPPTGSSKADEPSSVPPVLPVKEEDAVEIESTPSPTTESLPQGSSAFSTPVSKQSETSDVRSEDGAKVKEGVFTETSSQDKRREAEEVLLSQEGQPGSSMIITDAETVPVREELPVDALSSSGVVVDDETSSNGSSRSVQSNNTPGLSYSAFEDESPLNTQHKLELDQELKQLAFDQKVKETHNSATLKYLRNGIDQRDQALERLQQQLHDQQQLLNAQQQQQPLQQPTPKGKQDQLFTMLMETMQQMRRDREGDMNYVTQRLEAIAHEQKEQKYEMDVQKHDKKSKATGLKESTESVGIQDRVASSTATTNL